MFDFSQLFGYDVFISYRRADSTAYATALRDRLSAAGFSSFLDLDETPPGEELTPTLERALRRSQMLAFVGTSAALQSPWVLHELAFFRKICKDKKRMLLLNIGSALRSRPSELAYLDELVWINEDLDAVHRGDPSPNVLNGIRRSFTFTRRNIARRRTVIAVMNVLLIVALLAVWQAVRANAARREAEVQQSIAQMQKSRALEILEWIVAETVHYDFNQSDFESLTPEAQNVIRGLIARLVDLGFTGDLLIEGHRGQFCVAPGTYRMPNPGADGAIECGPSPGMRLAGPSIPIEECEFYPDTKKYGTECGLAMADVQAAKIRSFLQTIETPASIRLKSISYGMEKPRRMYPEKGAAADWNAIARINNGIQIKITEAKPEK